MGRSKALLPMPDGQSFVSRVAHQLRGGGVAEVLVVGRPDDDPLRAVVQELEVAVRFVANPDAAGGQITSILAALQVVDRPGVHGLLVTPVDLPLITSTTVKAILDQFTATHAPIVRAVHGGAHGHPVVFGREAVGSLRRADLTRGAKAVLREYEARILNVEVADPGVLHDLDTPDDYRRAFGNLPPEI
jgi:CTP:molybdopterin cytidylyltransferase MocA